MKGATSWKRKESMWKNSTESKIEVMRTFEAQNRTKFSCKPKTIL